MPNCSNKQIAQKTKFKKRHVKIIIRNQVHAMFRNSRIVLPNTYGLSNNITARVVDSEHGIHAQEICYTCNRCMRICGMRYTCTCTCTRKRTE